MQSLPQSHRIRVVVADDSRFARRIIQQLLEDSGEFDVVSQAADGDEAIAQVLSDQPDLLILDYHMPTLNGMDVLRRLRPSNPIPVLLVTAMPPQMENVVEEARALGVSAIITKTFTEYSINLHLFRDELLTQARRAVRAGQNNSLRIV